MQREPLPDDIRGPAVPIVVVPSGAVLGWRIEFLSRRQVAVHDGPRTKPVHQMRVPNKSTQPWVPFSSFDAAGCSSTATCQRPYMAAQYPRLWTPHSTPDPRCSCGYRVVPTLSSLVGYVLGAEGRLRASSWSRRTRLDPVAIYSVMGFGKVIRSGAGFDDPPESVRVSHLRMTGTFLLPATGKGREVARTLRRFECATDVRSYRGLDQVVGIAS